MEHSGQGSCWSKDLSRSRSYPLTASYGRKRVGALTSDRDRDHCGGSELDARWGDRGVNVFRGVPTLLTKGFVFLFFARTSFHDVVDRTEVAMVGLGTTTSRSPDQSVCRLHYFLKIRVRSRTFAHAFREMPAEGFCLA